MYSCPVPLMLLKFIYLSSKFFFNIEKQKATGKHITHLKLADNPVTEDEQGKSRTICI